jgi:hypothetical protein
MPPLEQVLARDIKGSRKNPVLHADKVNLMLTDDRAVVRRRPRRDETGERGGGVRTPVLHDGVCVCACVSDCTYSGVS